MDQTEIFLTLIGMFLVTYLPRLTPVWLLSARKIPAFIESWLEFVPTSVMAAMLAVSIFKIDQAGSLRPDNLFILAALVTMAVAWKTRSFFGSVLVGIILVALVRFFLNT